MPEQEKEGDFFIPDSKHEVANFSGDCTFTIPRNQKTLIFSEFNLIHTNIKEQERR